MKYRYVFFLLLLHSLLPAKSIRDYLNTRCSHISPQAQYLDATFVIRLNNQKDLSEIKQGLDSHGIPLVEYNKFNILPAEVMNQYCSAIVSPYLLTQTLSHLSIFQYCLEHQLSRVLIIEDNAQLVGDPHHLEKILNSISEPWDILFTDVDYHDAKTGNVIVPVLAEIPQNRRQVNADFSKVFCRYGSASYVISRSGMEKILKFFQNNWVNLPYDQILFKIPNLNIYGSNIDIITNQYTVGGKEEKSVLDPKPSQHQYSVNDEFWIHPTELLCFDRFDIIPKYIYASYSINKYETNWHVDLYKSYLEKWVRCYNTKPLKIGFNDFRLSFDTLIQGIRTKGFDEGYAVGINNFNVPWNGAHRIGTCLALDTPIKVKAMKQRPSQDLTAKAFKEQYHLEDKYLDHMAFEYAKLKKTTFIACLYPTGRAYKEKAEKILKKHGAIIHQKDIWLTDSGILEFIRLIYTGEWWTGSYLDDFKHSRGKALLTFPQELRSTNPVRVYLFECDSKSTATKAKVALREFCQKGNEVIHINDTHEQTKVIAATLFNQNSIDFINKRKLNQCENFDRLFEKLKEFIAENQLNPEHFCIDTSAVMSAYGIRDCVDIDVLHRDPLPPSFKECKIDSHNRYLNHHVKGLDEILMNPENHFYYQGIKFIRLDLLKQMKENRGSEKDQRDIKLIF